MSDVHSAGWRPATYYPDPAIHALDPRFEKYWLKLSAVERIATGLRWAEGPVWFGDGRYLLCSDIPNQRILKWEEETGAVSVFRKPSNFANGNTRDREGRLVTCEHGARRVTRTEHDGRITVIADSFEGKRLNSPNDVVVKSDGTIWFTDPLFGIGGDYEGERAESEIPAAGRLHRADLGRPDRRESAVGHGEDPDEDAVGVAAGPGRSFPGARQDPRCRFRGYALALRQEGKAGQGGRRPLRSQPLNLHRPEQDDAGQKQGQ